MNAKTTATMLSLIIAVSIGAEQQLGLAGGDFLQREVAQLNRLLASPSADLRSDLITVTGDLVDFGLLAEKSFGGYCESSLDSYRDTKGESELGSLIANCKRDLSMAYRDRVFADFTRVMGYNVEGRLEILGYNLMQSAGIVRAHLISARGNFAIEIELRRIDGGWKIIDVDLGTIKVSRHYSKLGRSVTRANYSLPVLVAKLKQRPYVILEDFSSSSVGQLPSGWSWRDRDDDKPKPYKINASNRRHYLAAQDSGGSVILLKFSHWNPREFPILTWCWRASTLPSDGDERYDHTNDSAAGLYVNFSTNWIGLPKHIKYVWSTTLPVGTVDRRKRIARPWFFVVESGTEKLGNWVFERVDLSRDYDQVYSGRPAKRTVGLGILTDANSTDSIARADYADVRAWTREADIRGDVQDHCSCDFEGMSAEGIHDGDIYAIQEQTP